VDIPGDALSCVVIDKLPFESPNDPVLQARMKAIEESGKNPFMSYSLPRAVISLRQGAGRLIRGSSDRGLLMLCDPRIRTARYGKIFIDSLPPMRQTIHQAEAVNFLQSTPHDQNEMVPF
jgi:ATP-dependent DNA helicase DinG